MSATPAAERREASASPLVSRLLACSTAATGAAAAETLCVVTRSKDAGGFAFAVVAFGEIALVALVLAGLGCGLWLAVTSLLTRLRREQLLGAGAGYRPVDFLAAALVVLPVALPAIGSCLASLATRFKNLELLALASGFLALSASLLAALAWAALSWGARALRTRLRAALRGAVLLPGGVLTLAAAGHANRAGLGQLDAWLLAAPLAGLGLGLLGARLRQRFTGRVVGLTLSAFLAVTVSLGAFGATTQIAPATKLWASGAWCRPIIELLRKLSDFDGDGVSGLFGGADCAPFDPTIYPGRAEVALDGIDNNCVGGDAGRPVPWPSPKPSPGGARGPSTRLNLVLVTIETVRADHVSFLGYSRPTTPHMAELARSSVVFERSYATAPNTRLSIAALLSGRLPSAIRWHGQEPRKQMRRMAADTPWLPATLARHGYVTLAVHANFRAFTQVESAGFERGFTHYDTSTELVYSGGTMRGFPGGEQVDRALALLDEIGARPLFLWLHLLEPHYLYEQSPFVPRFGDDELALYDAELAEADRQVGRLLEGLRARHLFDTSLLVISGDHGEEFGEHGQRWHGSNLYDPQLRTATLLRVPGLAGRRVSEPVSFLDLAPTVLDLLGIDDGFQRLMGRNLVPFLRGGPAPEPGFFVESFKVDDGSQALTGLVAWPFKLVRSARQQNPELYDLSQDPRERRDLWQADDPLSRELTNRLYQYLESGVAPGAVQNGP